MTRRQPLQNGAENVRDLFESEPAVESRKNGNALRKPLRQTRDRLEQIVDPNAVLAEKFGPAARQKRGFSEEEVEYLVWEYWGRTPQERPGMLSAMQMPVHEMAGLFQFARNTPELPEADPVLVYCNRNGENEKERLGRAREIPLARIVTRDTTLWTRAVSCFASAGLSTLGALSDADPDEVGRITNYGEKQRVLAGEILKTYGLLTPVWAEHLKKPLKK